MVRSDPAAPRSGPRGGRAALAVLLVAVTLVAGTPGAAQDGGPGPTDAEALRREYEDLVGDEADTLVAYDRAAARLAELLPRLQEADEAVRRADEALEGAEQDLVAGREAEARAAEALEAARQRVTEAETLLRGHAVQSYVGAGGAGALGTAFAILDGESEALARQGYQESVSAQQQALVDELVEARGQASTLAGEATAARQRAQDQRDAVDRLRAAATEALATAARLTREAADERNRQDLLLVDIRSRLVSIEARIVSLDRAADGVAAVLAAYQANDPDWEEGAVEVGYPAPGYPIGSEFGMRAHPILNVTRLHAGADIGAPAGTPVLSVADGIVLLAEDRGGYGLTVVVAHGFSLGTVYAHNSALNVSVGDVVERGDEVARVGSTGLSTGPHIHFETRIKGVPVNPRNFLPA